MGLSTAQSRVLYGNAVGSVFCNFPLNAALAWVTFPPVESLPLWARGPCVGFDAIGTSFFLPFITCLIVTSVTRRLTRKNVVAVVPRAELPGWLRVWPANFVGRGAIIGLACALTIALVIPSMLGAFGFAAMTRGQMAIYKAIYTTVLGLVVTPLFAWRALADETRDDRGGPVGLPSSG